MKKSNSVNSIKGLVIALTVIGAWATSLVFLLTSNLSELHPVLIPLAILWQALLYTGLFITAHDAMHGAVFPAHIKMNDAIGAFVVLIYALFDYRNLFTKHWYHHKDPASQKDPDFHDGIHKNFLQWYYHFIRNYINWKQPVGMAIIFNVLLHLFHIPVPNLLLFWVTPAILSTLQLFYFGTFLPHREPEEGYKDNHRAKSIRLPVLLSLLTCYHFGGFHWEHHEFPNVAWWQLPGTRGN